MDTKPIQFNESLLKSYSALFAQCFPSSAKFGLAALKWLYTRNPAGNTVGSPIRLFLGLYPEGACGYQGYVSIPQRFRLSPLNFFFRPLREGLAPLTAGTVTFSFLDFDAY